MSAAYWIGPSGWSYADWNGVVYPARRPRGFQPLRLIGEMFNAVEVNSSFYRIPSAQMTAQWPPQTPERFRFAFKLTQIFTHERSTFPEQSDVEAFADALRPIADAGKLGPVLMQFPWSFRFKPESVDWLHRLRDAFPAFERFVEVRHSSWTAPEALDALVEIGGVCSIDQPQLRDCLPPTDRVVGRDAYVRLHGRNAGNWFADNVPAYERYNYLYNDAELAEWIDRLRRIADAADNAYVFANNHFQGQSVANALELEAALENRSVLVPESLLAAYPQLSRVALPPRAPKLFPDA